MKSAFGLWIRSLAVIAAAMALSTAGRAATIGYSEGTDLHPNSIADATMYTSLGALDVGTNTVSGAVSCATVTGSSYRCDGDEADAFRVQLPSGMQITSITITVTSFGATSGVSAYSGIYPGPNFNVGLAAVDMFANGTHSFLSSPYSTAGDLQFITSVFPALTELPYSGSYSYQWTIEVANGAAPEPSTIALLGLSIAGLAALRGRKA